MSTLGPGALEIKEIFKMNLIHRDNKPQNVLLVWLNQNIKKGLDERGRFEDA